MDKETKKAIREQTEIESDLYENSEESLNKDFETLEQRRAGTGDFIPDDLFKYKYLRIVPKAQDKYDHIVDKDAVLSNVGGKKPDIEELSFTNQTVVLIQQIFKVAKKFLLTDDEGNIVFEDAAKRIPKIVERNVFDEAFVPLIEGLLSYTTSQQVLSRAIGDDREAILDRTTTLQKGITKKNEKKKNVLGFGGE